MRNVKHTNTRSRGLAIVTAVLTAVTGLVVVAPGGAPAASAMATPATADAGSSSRSAWELTATDPFGADYNPTFTGNGYFAARVPASGQGYSSRDVPTQFEIGGFYASGLPNEARASGPAWTGLTVSDGSGTFDQAFDTPCVVGHACQLEDAALSGGPSVATDHSGYRGSGFVQGWNSPAASGDFTATGGVTGTTYDLVLRYAAGDPGDGTHADRSITVTVDGSPHKLTLPPSPGNDWDTWMEARLPVTFTSDRATVDVGCASGDDCRVNLDELAFVKTGADIPTTDATPTMADHGLADYRQTLDLATGAIVTSARWTSPQGRVSDVDYTVLTDRASDRRGLVRVRVTPRWSGDLTVTDVLDTRAESLIDHTVAHRDPAIGSIGLDAVAKGSAMTASYASTLRGPGERSAASPAGLPSDSVAQQLTAHVRAGQTYEFVKYVGLATTQDGTDTAALAAASSASGAALGYGRVRAESDRSWAKLWDGDIRVSGNNALQQQVRASRFYLLASTSATRALSPSPAGLSSDGYGGHTFWDTETWMWPSLVAQDPAIAASVLKYRSDRLADAAANAAAGGNAGIRFPWEGAQDGKEQTTATLFGQTEQHITADVALAFWQYYLATGDRKWLASSGWPVISGAADFWASRAQLGADGMYHIENVTSPDEWAGAHDDSAYTNVAAAQTMRFAADAAQVLHRSAASSWTTMPDRMYVPSDPTYGVTSEYEGYAGATIKQADVVMLTYPWENPQSDELTARNLAYYAAKVTSSGGPSMTDAMHSIVSAQLGRACDAGDYTTRSVEPFMRAPFDQFSEESGGGAFTFTTGAGGFLQEFYYGYTGLRMQQDGIELAPILPPQVSGLALTGLKYHGATYTVRIGADTTTITVTGGKGFTVHAPSGDVRAKAGEPVTIPTRHSSDCGRTAGYGDLLGSLSAPAGGDDGPGTYVYPQASAFPAGAFDMTNFDVFRDHGTLNVVTTVSGPITNPWVGNGMSVQLLHAYISLPAAPGGSPATPVPALAGTNVDTAHAWNYLLIGNGRRVGGGSGTGLYAPDGHLVSPVTLTVSPRRHQIVLSFPESALGGADAAKASYAVAMMSEADDSEGVSNIRPVIDCTLPGTPDWASQWRICGGKGSISSTSPYDTDTSDPNILKIFAPKDRSQHEILGSSESPVVLPFVGLTAPLTAGGD